MNEQQRAVVQWALEAFTTLRGACAAAGWLTDSEHIDHMDNSREAITALRQMLEQLEPGPLTDEQANLLINGRGDEGDDDYVEPTGDGLGLTDEDLVKLIRRVEAHHGIEVKP
jgi:hypothetical protein